MPEKPPVEEDLASLTIDTDEGPISMSSNNAGLRLLMQVPNPFQDSLGKVFWGITAVAFATGAAAVLH